MQFRHLKTFSAVADTLNFTRAGERVHLSQSSVTEQIQALEADLGVQLFDRSRRRLALTAAGQRLLGHTADLLSLADDAKAAVSSASDIVTGNLVVGGLETLCATRMPSLLAEFHRRHPAVDLTLRAADSGGLRNWVRNSDIDVAFTFGAAPPREPDVHGEQVAEDEMLVIVPLGHRLASHGGIGPEDLADSAFMVTQPGCIYRRMFDDAFAATQAEQPRRIGEFASLASICGLVEAGIGCALMPRSALPARLGRFIAIPWTGPNRTVPVTMTWRRRRVLPPPTAAFLATARECLA